MQVSNQYRHIEVKMYYISMYVTPHWNQPDCQIVKKALARFWVEAKDSVRAGRKAINYSEKHQFEVHYFKQAPTPVDCEDPSYGAIESIHAQIAREQGISMCLTDWHL
jgi:hypothetical protein